MLQLLAVLVFVFVSGCSSIGSRFKEQTDRGYTTTSLISDNQADAIARKYFGGPAAADDKEKIVLDDWIEKDFLARYEASAEKASLRNDMIDDLFVLSDRSFNSYKISLFSTKKAVDFGADYYSLLLTGAAALTTGGATPNILAGIATFVTGVRTSFDKTVFSEKTVESLVNVMEGNRLKRKSEIIRKKGMPVNEYSLRTSLREILEMHQEGNIVAALAFIQKSTGQFQQEAAKEFEKAVPGDKPPSIKAVPNDDAQIQVEHSAVVVGCCRFRRHHLKLIASVARTESG